MFKWFKDKISNEENKEEKINIPQSEIQEDELDNKDQIDFDEDIEENNILNNESDGEIEGKDISREEVILEKDINEDVTLEASKSKIESEEESIEINTKVIKDENDEKPGFFRKIFSGLEKTRKDFSNKLGAVLGSYLTIDEEMYEDIEDILITADIGVPTTLKLIDNVKDNIRENKITDPNKVMDILSEEAKKLIDKDNINNFNPDISPSIILVVGVNGVGKTTTIGKLAARYKAEGKNVLLVAADTFRAAATEQLREWSNRAEVDLIAQDEGADPAAVVYDAIQAAKARNTDIVLVDTAGRLHNKANLMKELEKIYNIIEKNFPEANRESLIVLDATTGQNAINQAKQFKEVANVTGVVITKLDGTAKGGIILPIIDEVELPVTYIGVGEQIDDLQEFDSDTFIDSIFIS